MGITLVNRRLFFQKLTALATGTVLFVPLVYYEWEIPAVLYAGSLLAIHILFLYLYVARTPWRQLLRNKVSFGLRLTAVLFFVYLLSLIGFGGTPVQILIKLGAAFGIHVGILLALMAVRAPAAKPSASA